MDYSKILLRHNSTHFVVLVIYHDLNISVVCSYTLLINHLLPV